MHLGSTTTTVLLGAGTIEGNVWHSLALSSVLLLRQAEVAGALNDCLLTSWIDGETSIALTSASVSVDSQLNVLGDDDKAGNEQRP